MERIRPLSDKRCPRLHWPLTVPSVVDAAVAVVAAADVSKSRLNEKNDVMSAGVGSVLGQLSLTRQVAARGLLHAELFFHSCHVRWIQLCTCCRIL